MYEFIDLLNRLPRPLKYLGIVFLLTPMVYVISRMLGVQRYWWVFMLGLVVIALLLSLFDALVHRREKGQARAFEGEWGSFLRLLRRYRKFCPINGVLVVIPCTSLLEDSPEEQERKAQNIRQKL